MQFTTRSVTRFGRPMVMLSVVRKGAGALPVGYFLPAEVSQAKIDFANRVAEGR